MFLFVWCYRGAAPSGDDPDPPQCEQLLDCTWSEKVEGSSTGHYEPLSQNVPAEPVVEATEFIVSTIESEKRKISVKRDNKSKVEGSVAIEMSTQPLLELTPMTGRTFPLHLNIMTFSVSITVPPCRWILISEATSFFLSFVLFFFLQKVVVTHAVLCHSCPLRAEDVPLSVCIVVNSKELEAYQSEQNEEEDETEEEEPPVPPKPEAPDSMFIFKASNP